MRVNKVALGVGALVVGATVGALTTRTDGARSVHRKYARDYELLPTSKDAARASLNDQRSRAKLTAAGGTAALGVGSLATKLPHAGGIALLGAVLIGGSLASLFRLDGAERNVDSSDLPEHKPVGRVDMQKRYYGQRLPAVVPLPASDWMRAQPS